jgi:hypothetical protein
VTPNRSRCGHQARAPVRTHGARDLAGKSES